MMGIYLITNKINNKRYVGLSNNIKRRISEHFSPKNKTTKNALLYKAFRKYGAENFKVDILEVVENVIDLPEREIHWIALINPEYNISKGGVGNSRPISDKTRMALKESGKKQWHLKSEAEKQKVIKNNLRGPKYNHLVSLLTRNKLRAANLGKKQSKETISKRAEKLKVSALNNKNGNKPVVAIKDGLVVKIYESVKIAASLLGVHPSGITHTLKGQQKSCAGFEWIYLINL